MTSNQIIYLRLQRQGLIDPVDALAYESLFRSMSPVPTRFWIEPGTAPELMQRCDFDDLEANDFARRMRVIVKGRFQGGNVGYVYQDEMPLFAAAYRKPIKAYTEVEETLLTVLHNEGPMNLKMMKEITGILNKDLAKAAQHLQKAFIVFEDQVDKDNDRAWFLLEDELEGLDWGRYTETEAYIEVIRRCIYLNVIADEIMIKSLTKFTNKVIKASLEAMVKEGLILPIETDGPSGYILSEDQAKVEGVTEGVPDQLYLLDNNDYLVRSNGLKLKQRFDKSDYKTLAYIFKEGEFIGRLLGYFRFGPNDLEDVDLDVNPSLQGLWKDRIIELIQEAYEGQATSLKRYCGQGL